MSTPRLSVRGFARAMEEILRENDHKEGWEALSNAHLLGRIEDETKELESALLNGQWHEAQRECCDIANFCMMLFDNLGVRIRS